MNEAGAFDEAIQALLSATGHPSIFQLDNFDASVLTSNPSGEIEVSMGQQAPYSFDSGFIPDFSGFDFTGTAGSSAMSSQIITGNGLSPTDESPDFASLFPDALCSPTELDVYNADDFIDFDGSAHITSSSTVETLGTSQAADTISGTRPPVPYIPPAGAAYSSTRRVAGSWKPSFATLDSPIDVSPPRSWGVPAT